MRTTCRRLIFPKMNPAIWSARFYTVSSDLDLEEIERLKFYL
jgi:hypothetical protein